MGVSKKFLPIRLLVGLVLLSLMVFSGVNATTHTITFTCCEYTPSFLQASVGDTVRWLGAFGDHPLSSTTIPSGAAPFSANSGTSFSYVIQIAGLYNYHCDFHQPSMAGSFNASPSAQYPLVTIRQIQEVSLDSLRVLDTLQRTQTLRWTLQRSPYYQDTVRVRGVCVVPAKVIGFTASGFNMLIADTANPSQWGGLFVRPNLSTGSPDTTLAIQWGILNVEPGDYVELTGYIDEFPAGDPVSATQIIPLFNEPLTILGSATVPPHVNKLTSDFYKGIFPSNGPNGIQFSTGEPMEFMRVTLRNLQVVSTLNATNGTFNMVDQSGNSISTMDASKWFTTRAHRDPASTYALPPAGAVVDSIKGYIMTNSGQEAPRGYRIAPVYPGDIAFGAVVLPVLSTHRRNPIVVPPDSTPVVSLRVARGSVGIASVQLRYSINNGAFVNTPMTFTPSDTTYRASIPQQAADTFVKYYINVADSAGNNVKLASSAFDGSQSDTVRGFFFYTVLNRALTIRDVQQTPFLNGRSAYIGARVTLRGLVTADTASLVLPPTRFRGTNVWYMQSGNQPWSGIWLHNDSLSLELQALRNGDSVSITGTVAEDFDVTRLQAISPPTIHTSGNPLPAPIVLTTNTFGAGVGNGTPSAEQWEGMLVQFNNVVLSDTMPTFQEIYEFGVNDGSGQVILRRDGRHHFTTTSLDPTPGLVQIPLGSQISFLRGIVYYSGNAYKVVPRANSDFGTITGVSLTHTPTIPTEFGLKQNYPNPFNPSTTIEFSLPQSEFVTVKVYNTLGQEVETLVNGVQEAGTYTARFDASRLTSGVYFYRLQAGQFSQTKKMILLK